MLLHSQLKDNGAHPSKEYIYHNASNFMTLKNAYSQAKVGKID